MGANAGQVREGGEGQVAESGKQKKELQPGGSK